MLTITEAAARKGLSREWTANLVREGRLKATWNEQVKQWFIDDADLAGVEGPRVTSQRSPRAVTAGEMRETVSLRLPASVWTDMRRLAAANDRTMTKEVTRALRQYIERMAESAPTLPSEDR